MGSVQGRCGTCDNFSKNCNGHYGYIQLPFPVFSALLTESAIPLLEAVCLNCLKLPIIASAGNLQKQMKSLKTKVGGKCPHCKAELQHLQIEYLERASTKTKIPLYIKCSKFQAYHIKKLLTGDDQIQKGSIEQVILSQTIIQKILQNLIHQDEAKQVVAYNRLFDCFMFDALPVPPNSMRVLSQQSQGTHAMNAVYAVIIGSIQHLKDIRPVDDLYLAPFERYQELQYQRIVIGSRVALSKDTSRNSKPQIKQLLLGILGVSTQEPGSALSQCLTKKGWFRQYLSSVRVNMSARTVIVGDPWLDIDQVVIPQFFAEKLFIPVVVDNQNINKMKALINNYPNYPCALKHVYNGVQYQITEETKQVRMMQCQIGDIVMRQLVDNDNVLFQRYPSIREESFTALRVVVDAFTKAIKCSLGIIFKLGADFDGDEMEIFALPSLSNCMEAINLFAPFRQLITYENGLNLIGGNVGVQNIYPGIFHLQNEEFTNKQFINITGKNNDKKITGIDLVQMVFENAIYRGEEGKALLDSMNYDDGKIIVENGKFKKIDVSLVAMDSQFITFVQFHHSAQLAISMINYITHLSYQVNHVSAATVINNMFLSPEFKIQMKNIDNDRVRQLQDVMDDYYTGKIVAPAGFDLRQYFEKLYQDRLQDNEKKQLELIQNEIRIDGVNFLNQYYKEQSSKILTAICHLGQQLDQGQRLTIDPYYERTLSCYPKFEVTPQSEGYVMGNYMDGLLQKEMFMAAWSDRRNSYIKGNNTAISGYLARRINQGAGNMYCGANGIIQTDGSQIVCLQYGCGGYDPRCYIVLPFDKHSISQEDFDKKYKSNPRYVEMLQIRNDIIRYEEIMKSCDPEFEKFKEISVPFIFDQKSVSEEQLDKLFSCRICSKMSDGLKEVITSQVYMFYIYALFFLQIDNKSTYNLVEKYMQCLVQTGEAVGMKSALACSQPYTNGMLKAIHSKGGVMSIIQEQRTRGCIRFQELVIGNNGPTVVQFKLLGNMKSDQEKNIEFVSQNQTIKFSSLRPQITIEQHINKYCGFQKQIKEALEDSASFEKSSYSDFVMKVRFDIRQLSYYNVNLENMIKQMMEDNPVQIRQIIPFINDKFMYFIIYFINGIAKQQVSMIKTNLLTTQLIGSQLFYNLYYTKCSNNEYNIIGNVTNEFNETKKDALLLIHMIRGIDQQTIHCTDPRQYENHCGIIKNRLVLYHQLHHNLSTDDSTKAVQATHVKLMADLLTQSGQQTSFTRSSYRDEDGREMLGNVVFEQGDKFLEDEIKNPHRQLVTTMLSACVYGTRPELGSTVSTIQFDKVLQQQDQTKLQTMMDDR